MPRFFDHDILDNAQAVFPQKILKLPLIHHRPEIHGGQIHQFGLDEIQKSRVVAEYGLEKNQVAAGLDPLPDAVQHRLLILEKHEAHAEKDVVITAGGARPELFHGLMIDVDVVFHMVMTDQLAALAEIVTVDVDPIDRQHLIPYDRVKIGDHGAVTDADIKDCGLRWKIPQTVIITVGSGILDEKAIKAIAQSFHHFSNTWNGFFQS